MVEYAFKYYASALLNRHKNTWIHGFPGGCEDSRSRYTETVRHYLRLHDAYARKTGKYKNILL